MGNQRHRPEGVSHHQGASANDASANSRPRSPSASTSYSPAADSVAQEVTASFLPARRVVSTRTVVLDDSAEGLKRYPYSFHPGEAMPFAPRSRLESGSDVAAVPGGGSVEIQPLTTTKQHGDVIISALESTLVGFTTAVAVGAESRSESVAAPFAPTPPAAHPRGGSPPSGKPPLPKSLAARRQSFRDARRTAVEAMVENMISGGSPKTTTFLGRRASDLGAGGTTTQGHHHHQPPETPQSTLMGASTTSGFGLVSLLSMPRDAAIGDHATAVAARQASSLQFDASYSPDANHRGLGAGGGAAPVVVPIGRPLAASAFHHHNGDGHPLSSAMPPPPTMAPHHFIPHENEASFMSAGAPLLGLTAAAAASSALRVHVLAALVADAASARAGGGGGGGAWPATVARSTTAATTTSSSASSSRASPMVPHHHRLATTVRPDDLSGESYGPPPPPPPLAAFVGMAANLASGEFSSVAGGSVGTPITTSSTAAGGGGGAAAMMGHFFPQGTTASSGPLTSVPGGGATATGRSFNACGNTPPPQVSARTLSRAASERSLTGGHAVAVSGHVRPQNEEDRNADAMMGGFSVNQYLLLKLLGSGKQGDVYLAIDHDSGATRAVKIIPRPKALLAANHPNGNSPLHDGTPSATTSASAPTSHPPTSASRGPLGDQSGAAGGGVRGLRRLIAATRRLEQLQTEIAVLKRCRHRNVISLLEVIDDPTHEEVYLVMDHARHGALCQMSTDGHASKHFTPMQVISYGRQLCAGLRYLHDRGILHRDIKPENVLLGNDDTVYLSDFGVSSRLWQVGGGGARRGVVSAHHGGVVASLISVAAASHTTASPLMMMNASFRGSVGGSAGGGGSGGGGGRSASVATASPLMGSGVFPSHAATAAAAVREGIVGTLAFAAPEVLLAQVSGGRVASGGGTGVAPPRSAAPPRSTSNPLEGGASDSSATSSDDDESGEDAPAASSSAHVSQGNVVMMMLHRGSSDHPSPPAVRGAAGSHPRDTPAIAAAAPGRNGSAQLDVLKAADVWSLGVTLYVLLFGHLPWTMQTLPQYIDDVTDMTAAVPMPNLGAMHEPIVTILQRMVEKDHVKRWTAADVHAAFRQLDTEMFDRELLRQRQNAVVPAKVRTTHNAT